MNALPAFESVAVHAAPLPGGAEVEDEWMARVAATGDAQAHLWRAPAGLVVPRSYEQRPEFATAAAASALRGWPVQMRRSGGGLVPQGPGLLNISLVWLSTGARARDTDAVYIGLCDPIVRAFAQFDIDATRGEVARSFCDGRFNLAFRGRKLVGTAQAWRRIDGQAVTLAHASLFFDADLARLADVANMLELEVGNRHRYEAATMTTVVRAWCEVHDARQARTDLEAMFIAALVEEFTRAT